MKKSSNKRRKIQSPTRQSSLAKPIQLLSAKYAHMETTGEPFGTIVIADMGQKLREKGEDVIFCAESILSTKVPSKVLEQTKGDLERAATGTEAPFLGIGELRNSIASRFERLYAQRINWEKQVIVTSGSMQAEYYAMAALIDPGDEVIIPVPTFFFDIPVELSRGKSVFYKLDPKNNYYHDARGMQQLVTKKTKMLVICNPHNPTGRVLTEEELAGIADFARKNDLIVMHDQVYERIVFEGRPYIPLARFKEVHDRLISVSSFSKLFNMINYRLGFAIGPEEIIHGMELVQAFSSMGIPTMLQRGALAALRPEFEDRHISETLAVLEKARDYAVQKLGSIVGVEIRKPEGTNLIFPNISSFGLSSMEMCKLILKEAKVACAPGIAYHGEGHIRISLGNERVEEAIDRIASVLSGLLTKARAVA